MQIISSRPANVGSEYCVLMPTPPSGGTSTISVLRIASKRSTLRLSQQQSVSVFSFFSLANPGRRDSETHFVLIPYLPRRGKLVNPRPSLLGSHKNRTFLIYTLSQLYVAIWVVQCVASAGLAAGVLPLALHNSPDLGFPMP